MHASGLDASNMELWERMYSCLAIIESDLPTMRTAHARLAMRVEASLDEILQQVDQQVDEKIHEMHMQNIFGVEASLATAIDNFNMDIKKLREEIDNLTIKTTVFGNVQSRVNIIDTRLYDLEGTKNLEQEQHRAFEKMVQAKDESNFRIMTAMQQSIDNLYRTQRFKDAQHKKEVCELKKKVEELQQQQQQQVQRGR